MKQVFQDARSAEITVAEVPSPKLLPGCVLVRTAASLVSAGTERASSEFASKNLLQKARMRPDLVREVVSKISRDGLLATVSAVRSRLDQPAALGYSSAGTVVAVGEGVAGLNPGDRVACAGSGHAVHAELACIPRMMVARIPSAKVSFDEAAFTTVGAVALHGVRNADIKLGEVVAVIGLRPARPVGQIQNPESRRMRRPRNGHLPKNASTWLLRLGSRCGEHFVFRLSRICVCSDSAGHGADYVLITCCKRRATIP